MIRQTILKKLRKEAEGWGQITRLAKRIGIPLVTLWRIVKGKYGGNAATWDRIFKYYGK